MFRISVFRFREVVCRVEHGMVVRRYLQMFIEFRQAAAASALFGLFLYFGAVRLRVMIGVACRGIA